MFCAAGCYECDLLFRAVPQINTISSLNRLILSWTVELSAVDEELSPPEPAGQSSDSRRD